MNKKGFTLQKSEKSDNPYRQKYNEMWEEYENNEGEIYYKNSKGEMKPITKTIYGRRKIMVIKSLTKKQLLDSFPDILKGKKNMDKESLVKILLSSKYRWML
jgi:hypothetical protein